MPPYFIFFFWLLLHRSCHTQGRLANSLEGELPEIHKYLKVLAKKKPNPHKTRKWWSKAGQETETACVSMCSCLQGSRPWRSWNSRASWWAVFSAGAHPLIVASHTLLTAGAASPPLLSQRVCTGKTASIHWNLNHPLINSFFLWLQVQALFSTELFTLGYCTHILKQLAQPLNSKILFYLALLHTLLLRSFCPFNILHCRCMFLLMFHEKTRVFLSGTSFSCLPLWRCKQVRKQHLYTMYRGEVWSRGECGI